MAKSPYKEQFDELVSQFNVIKLSANKYVTALGDATKQATTAKDGIIEIFNTIKEKEKEFNDYSTNLKEKTDDIDDSHEKISDVYNNVISLRDSIFGKNIKEDEEITQEEAATLEKNKYIEKQGKYYKQKNVLITGISHKISQYGKILDEKSKKYDDAIRTFESKATNQLNDN